MAFVSLALQPTAAAAAGGTLFAITGQTVVSRVDPVAGTSTPITGDLSGPNQGQLVTITGDPSTHRIFTIRTTVSFDNNGNFLVTNEVLTIDSQTGTVLSDSPDIGKPVQDLAFDPASGVLYGMAYNAIYRVDPTSGAATLVANLPDLGPTINAFALVPGGNTIYVNEECCGFGTPTDQVLTVNTRTGVVTNGPLLAQAVRIITYDSAAGTLFGASECCPRQLIRIDPVTGAETTVVAFNNSNDQSLEFAMAVDPSTNTVFNVVDTFSADFTTTQSQIVSMNDESGTTNISPLLNGGFVSALYFELVTITAESIKADVRQALAGGAIRNAGIAGSLLAKLDAASASRLRGDCATAANQYRAAINEINTQTGSGIAAATATTLIGDAQYLIAHCP